MIAISLYLDGRLISEIREDGSREISIGRSPGCIVRLPDPTVSRLHAVINYTDVGYVLDKKSPVGSLTVNGEEVENAILQGGEEIAIANIILRVNLEIDQEVSASSIPLDAGDDREPSRTSLNATDPDGATKVLQKPSTVGLLRFEPGSANVTEYSIDKDLVVVGRASNCDVVIFEKRASRKHFEIRREGLTFYFKDLESANGSLVNEKSVKECELIPGDIIRIGESKAEFTIENKDFFRKKDQLMAVPQEAMPSSTPASEASVSPLGFPSGIPGIDDGAAPESEPEEKSLFKKRWKQFQKLPRVQRLGVIAVFAFIAIFAFEEPPPEKPKKPPIQRDAQGNPVITIDRLPPSEQKLVQDAYKRAILARESGDFEKMLQEISFVLTKVTKFRDAQLYKQEAIKGIEEKERAEKEAQRQKFEAKVREEVEKLVVKGQALYKLALNDEDKRPLLDDLIQEIFSKDPNNSPAQQWQEGIKRKIAKDAEDAEREAREKAEKEKAESAFAKLDQLISEEKYLDAIAYAEKLLETRYDRDDYKQRVQEKKGVAQQRIAAIILPLLERAQKERADGGDLVQSKELYREVLKTDPTNQEANEGLIAIRSVLHLRAKRLYAQAILAESVSALDEAKQKLEQCLRVAPERDPYERRCTSKLRKYEAFSKEER